MTTAIDEIAACRWMYLHAISEPRDNSLRLVLHEAVSGGPPSQDLLDDHPPEMRHILAASAAIEHRPGCRVFELVWNHCLAYCVLDESYAVGEPASSVGRIRGIAREYTSSAYLDYLSRAARQPDFQGPVTHWAVSCLNHIVDVASADAPRVAVSIAR